MKRVVIESPFAGKTDDETRRNIIYAHLCVRDCLRRNEAAFASHLFYAQVLDDNNPRERRRGMEAGFIWGEAAQIRAVYTDLGISGGMREGIKRANQPVEYRKLSPALQARFNKLVLRSLEARK